MKYHHITVVNITRMIIKLTVSRIHGIYPDKTTIIRGEFWSFRYLPRTSERSSNRNMKSAIGLCTILLICTFKCIKMSQCILQKNTFVRRKARSKKSKGQACIAVHRKSKCFCHLCQILDGIQRLQDGVKSDL